MESVWFTALENFSPTDQVSKQSEKARETILHVWKCPDCRNKLDIAEYALLLNVHHRGGSTNLNVHSGILRSIYHLFALEEPTTKQLQWFLRNLKQYLNSGHVIRLHRRRDEMYSGIDTFVIGGEGEGDPIECSICFEKFVKFQPIHRVVRCMHEFHSTCLDEWLETKSTCPMCRQRVQARHNFDWCGR